MVWGLISEKPEKQARMLNKKDLKSFTKDYLIYEIMKHPLEDRITRRSLKDKLLTKIPVTYESYMSQGFSLSKKSGLITESKKEWG